MVKKRTYLSDEQKKQFIIDYNEKFLSCEQIALNFKVDPSVVSNYLKNKISFRPKVGVRKYFIKENYFEKIDSNEKAYFLGFLYSDGCVSDTNFRLKLHIKDKCILEKFSQIIFGEDRLKIATNKVTKKGVLEIRTYSLLRVCSIKMAKDLINLGCFKAKSLILQFPTLQQVPEEYLSHFIRGFFDGDGSVLFKKKKVNIISTFYFLEKLISILENKANIKIQRKMQEVTKEVNNGKSTRCIEIWNYNDIIKFMNFIYKNCEDLFLKRKLDVFKRIESDMLCKKI